MSFQEQSFSPDQFCGTARLFPLPNLVMFPHVMQPLHVFEPRYRALLEESLAHDKLIALALLAPGWEQDYDGRPPIRPVGCLCRVTTHHQTEQGTYNALLLGLRRIKVGPDLPPTKLFREAEATIIDDIYPADNALRRPDLQRRLVAAFRRVLPKLPAAGPQIEQLLSSQISLGPLTDIVSYTLNLDQKIKEDLLAQPLPDLRALLLLECLTKPGRGAPQYEFPPAFSAN